MFEWILNGGGVPHIAGEWSLSQTLTQPNPWTGAQFGVDMAVSGDNTTLVIASKGISGVTESRNLIYIYKREGDLWVYDTEIHPQITNSYYITKSLLHVSSDGGIIFFVDPWNGLIEYRKTGNVWTKVHTVSLTSSKAVRSLSMSDNGNRVLVGSEGRVELFDRIDGGWSESVTVPILGGSGIMWGSGVYISGDGLTSAFRTQLTSTERYWQVDKSKPGGGEWKNRTLYRDKVDVYEYREGGWVHVRVLGDILSEALFLGKWVGVKLTLSDDATTAILDLGGGCRRYDLGSDDYSWLNMRGHSFHGDDLVGPHVSRKLVSHRGKYPDTILNQELPIPVTSSESPNVLQYTTAGNLNTVAISVKDTVNDPLGGTVFIYTKP